MSLLRRRAIIGAQGGGVVVIPAIINFDLINADYVTYKTPPKLNQVTNSGTDLTAVKFISNRGTTGDNANYIVAEQGVLFPPGDQNIACVIDTPLGAGTNIKYINRSVYFVTRPITTNSERMIVFGAAGNNHQLRYDGGNPRMLYYSSSTGSRNFGTSGVTSGVKNVIGIHSTASSQTITIDGQTDTFGGINANDGFDRVGTWSGGSLGLDGYLHQILVFDQVHDLPQQAKVISELKTRWNINHF